MHLSRVKIIAKVCAVKLPAYNENVMNSKNSLVNNIVLYTQI